MAKNHSEEQKTVWLSEHLPFEYGMMRHSLQRLQSTNDVWDWNAFHASFCVASRNLAAFLTNKDKNNVTAGDLVRDFKSQKGDLQGPFSKLDEQVFHNGPKRPTQEGKVTLENLEQIAGWIEKEIGRFVTDLNDKQKSIWISATSELRDTIVVEIPNNLGALTTSTSALSASSLPRTD